MYALSLTSGLNDTVAVYNKFIIKASQSTEYFKNNLTHDVKIYNYTTLSSVGKFSI